jgi:hypothetical protein
VRACACARAGGRGGGGGGGWEDEVEGLRGLGSCPKVDGDRMATEIPDGWAVGQVGMCHGTELGHKSSFAYSQSSKRSFHQCKGA